MRVDLTTFGVEPPDNGKTGRAGQSRNSGSGASSSTSISSSISNPSADQASFSFDQARVQSLQARVLAQPEIREAKVQSLQQAINNGEYSIPASQVADALVHELSGELGGGAGG